LIKIFVSNVQYIVRIGLLKGRPIVENGASSPNVDQNREWVKNPFPFTPEKILKAIEESGKKL
jgi:hypothetical protein